MPQGAIWGKEDKSSRQRAIRNTAHLSVSFRRNWFLPWAALEPIALAHCAAKAKEVLGQLPDKVVIGAKASCASKITMAVEAGILGYNMHIRNHNFQPDDGLVGDSPEKTIANIGRLGKQGMKAINEEIIKIMVGE